MSSKSRIINSSPFVFLIILISFVNLINCANFIQNPGIEKLGSFVNEKLLKNVTNFYNYSIVCGGERARVQDSFIDETIPNQYREMIKNTYVPSKMRAKSCPIWNDNLEAMPSSGAMESLKIPEDTLIGEKVYVLSAMSTSQKNERIYYFIRPAEVETDSKTIFNINTIPLGSGYFGEVRLAESLDYEKKKVYNYLAYAYDGFNLIESYSRIEVTDVDDVWPTIKKDHPNFNKANNRFEFKIFENTSVGHTINSDSKILFDDIDTQISQLKIKLVNFFTGQTDLPFSLSNNGDLIVTSVLDYEVQDQYLMKINVKDGSRNGFAEEIVNIEILDVADLPPTFIIPNDTNSEISFFENQIGHMFDVKAVSSNNEPLGEITYKISSVSPVYLWSYFELTKNQNNDTYVNCTKKIELNDGTDLTATIKIKAKEAAINSPEQKELIGEKSFNVKIVSGDVCQPRFDKNIYEFTVVENQIRLLEPILVDDCDHGVNGQIFLSTSDDNFHFKLDQVYRQANLAIGMKRSFDFEDKIKIIEFTIFAQGSSLSINKYKTNASVKLEVKNLNEFTPQFILPPPKFDLALEKFPLLKNKYFSYQVEENKDFNLLVKAVDADEGVDGQLVYGIQFINKDDESLINSKQNNEDGTFHITIPGIYLDSQSNLPIDFIVTVHDSGEPRLSNDMYFNIKAKPAYFRPVYFEFRDYSFDLIENTKTDPIRLKVIDDNLDKTNLTVVELNDPLNLISFLLDLSNSENELNQNFIDEDQMDEIDNERSIMLFLTNSSRDFDELFIENNFNNIYEYSLKIALDKHPDLSTNVTVRFKLLDDNDNKPIINVNEQSTQNNNQTDATADDVLLEASLSSDFKLNSPIEFLEKNLTIRVNDFDFSPDFGIESIYTKINDTRFYVDNEIISKEIEKLNSKRINLGVNFTGVPLIIRVRAAHDQFDFSTEPTIWLNVTCMDNYFQKRLNKAVYWSSSILIKIQLIDSNVEGPKFEKDSYEFRIDENWTGSLGPINAFVKNQKNLIYSLEPYLSDQNEFLNEHFELVNQNELFLKKSFDFEKDAISFNLTIKASVESDTEHSKLEFGRARVIITVNDLNDNFPTFIQNEFEFFINGSKIDKDFRIGSIYGTDSDKKDWSNLTFSLLAFDGDSNANRIEKFQLLKEPSNEQKSLLEGVALISLDIIDKKDLIDDSSNTYKFQIVVKDSVSHQTTSTIKITFIEQKSQIFELDWYSENGNELLENNEKSLVKNKERHYIAVIEEKSSANSFVVRVRALANSSLPTIVQNSIRYKLVGPTNPYYRINELTGEIFRTEVKLNRKKASAQEKRLQTTVYVQAMYQTTDSSRSKREATNSGHMITLWSPIATVEINIIENENTPPLFLVPSTNTTRIFIKGDDLKKNSSVYIFKSFDADPDDKITYNLVKYEILKTNTKFVFDSQSFELSPLNQILILPFRMNQTNGSLNFEWKSLSFNDYINLIQSKENFLLIRLVVDAFDTFENSARTFLFVEIDLESFFELMKEELIKELSELNLRLEITSPHVKLMKFDQITEDSDNTTTDNNGLPLGQKPFSIGTQQTGPIIVKLNESTPISTTIGRIISSVNNTDLDRLPILLRMCKISPNMQQNSMIQSINNIDPETYFAYDPINGTIKLVRKLNFEQIKSISFCLYQPDSKDSKIQRGPATGAESSTSKPSPKKYDVEIQVIIDDSNQKPPKLNMDKLGKIRGENLLVVSISDLSEMLPNQQSLDIMKQENKLRSQFVQSGDAAADFQISRQADLIKKFEKLFEFNKYDLVGSFRIIDSDKSNNFTVKFVKESTSKEVIDHFTVSTNSTHVLFRKKLDKTLTHSAAAADLQLTKSTKSLNPFFQFSIELNDGINSDLYNGDLYNVTQEQISRLVQIKETEIPRFTGFIQISSEINSRIKLTPALRLINPFPLDLNLRLEGELASYFDIYPKHIKSWLDNNFFSFPNEIELFLVKSLDDIDDKLKQINLELKIFTKNNYVNRLLESIPINLDIDIGFENTNRPFLLEKEPENEIIVLNEGTYENRKIASVRFMVGTKRDSLGLEYFLIGSSLLQINKTTGDVFLNGELDAESVQQIKFYCYAQNLEADPFKKQSDMVNFTLVIKDVDDNKPVIQPITSLLIVKENDANIVYPPNFLTQQLIQCYDKDITANVSLTLNSIGYVNKENLDLFINDQQINANDFMQLKDMLRLIFKSDLTLTSISNHSDQNAENNIKEAHLALSHSIDYEKLFKPNETYIRVDLMCSDRDFESESRIFIKVEDLNDNSPQFLNKSGFSIRIKETTQFESMLKIAAIDNDLSEKFGNESLVYSILDCKPAAYGFSMDKRTGDLYSKQVIDVDTEKLMEKRIADYLIDQNLYLQEKSLIEIDCSFQVRDNYGKDSNETLNDILNMTIEVENLNDNAPLIIKTKLIENSIEIQEGEATRGMVIAQIQVNDTDDATGLKCEFENFVSSMETFEIRTKLDKQNPFIAWCILKVRDDSFISYDAVPISSFLFDLIVYDNQKPPIYPNPGFARFQLKVRIIPVNNKPPVFVNGNEETFFTLDSIRPGTVIGTILATDLETPYPDRIIYKLDDSTSPAKDKFELVSRNSSFYHWGSVSLITKAKLDVEESPYILTVIAYDGPIKFKDTLRSRKIIKVFVLNKTSMSVWVDKMTGEPVEYYSANVEEQKEPFTQVIKVQAVISNIFMEDNQSVEIRYELESNLTNRGLNMTNFTNPYYQINSITGEISTTNIPLDYEETDPFKKHLMRDVRIRAFSSDGFYVYSTHISFEILDINDNPPIFDNSLMANFNDSFFCTIENQTLQETPLKIGSIHAIDLDSGLNGQVRYRLNENSTNFDSIKDLFQVDKLNGNINVIDGSKLDREINQTIPISIVAYDLGTPTLFSISTFKICLLDINDNAPKFANDLITSFKIEENSLRFTYKLTATDLDFGSNGTIYYYIDNKTPEISRKFFIDPITGEIGLLTPFDYEEKKSYLLTVIASDNGQPNQLRTSVNIEIDVIDLNDNRPRFDLSHKNSKEATVTEKSNRNDQIGEFEAIDLDSNEIYRNTSYRVRSIFASSIEFHSAHFDQFVEIKKDLFTIDRKKGVLTLNSQFEDLIDFSRYIIEIEAFDEDKPTEFFDRLNFTLIIENISSKKPIIESTRNVTLFRKNLRENLDVDNPYLVDIVKAIDPLRQGINYKLDSVKEVFGNELPIPTNETMFSIGVNDGVVRAIRPRSFHKADSYILGIRVTSKVDEVLSSFGELVVLVDSTRDSLFDSHVYILSVSENSPKFKKLIQLSEKLVNTQKDLKYIFNQDNSIPTKVYDKWFNLDENTGLIQTISDQIDYEKFSESLLFINVLNKQTNDLIETVLCKIEIIDMNDNAPIFDSKYNYEPKINEDDETTIDQERLITKFAAFDLDGTLNNSAIEYSIESVEPRSELLNEKSFMLNKTENSNDEFGLFKLKMVNMDRDSSLIGNAIRVKIQAKDTGIPSQSTSKIISISLMDLNDNPPVIQNLNKLEEVEVLENHTITEPIIKINATDLDQDLNGALIYEIIDERTNLKKTNFFSIDQTGSIFLKTPLDYEREKNFSIMLQVFDKSINPLFVKKKINILVQNVNDNPPEFVSLPKTKDIFDDQAVIISNQPCILEIVEGKWTTGASLYNFSASDSDQSSSPNDGAFLFELIQVSTRDLRVQNINLGTKILDKNLFRVNSNGELKVSETNELDREAIDNYKLVINLKDQEILGIQLQNTIECHLKILDINDNSPIFMPDQLNTNNTEIRVFPVINETSVINWFGATDLDLGLNGSVEYKLEVLNNGILANNLFDINSKGYLTLNAQSLNKVNSLDVKDLYDLKITASDMGIPTKLESFLNLRIKIDENFFKLSHVSFDKLELNAPDVVNLDENSEKDELIAKVNVLNSVLNRTMSAKSRSDRFVNLKFRLLTCNDVFSIDEKTGIITILNSTLIDYEKVKNYFVLVEAVETYSLSSANQTRTGNINILVKIKNVNDNPPVFNRQFYEFSCDENVFTIPFELFTGKNNEIISVIDKDLANIEEIPVNQLDKVSLKLNGLDSDLFQLMHLHEESTSSKSLYKLQTLSPFDFETKSTYDFKIEAWDGKFKSSSVLTVNIIDLNDNAPKFERKLYEFRIDENSAIESFVGRIKANDFDASPQMSKINYKLVNMTIQPGPLMINNTNLVPSLLDISKTFKLDEQTGELSVNLDKLLDRESILYFNLSIIAYNPLDTSINGSRMIDTCVVKVVLSDINDNPPKFDQSTYLINVREKSETPRLVFKINAIDMDFAENSTVRYLIESINGRPNTREQITFREFNLNTQINRANENKTEFHVDPIDGSVYLNSFIDMDSEDSEKQFEIILVAYDLGSQLSLKDKANLIVNFIDVNDIQPKITFPIENQIFKIDENDNLNASLPTSSLFQIKASDPDFSHHQIKYELDKDINDDWKNFRVDNTTGEVFSQIKFDFETKKEFNLRFKCIDQDGIMIKLDKSAVDKTISENKFILNDSLSSYPFELSSFVSVKIQINDLDDNEPEFSNSNEPFVKNISEIFEVGTRIMFIPLAIDRDTEPENTDIRYFIISGNEDIKFSLNEKNGELKLEDELERTIKNVYELKIIATSKPMNRIDQNFSNDTKSILTVILNVVEDKLFIEFDNRNYFINVQYLQTNGNQTVDVESDDKESILSPLKHLKFNRLDSSRDSSTTESLLIDTNKLRKLQDSSVFFSRAHLKQRKVKRKVAFRIELGQSVKLSDNIPQLLPVSLINTIKTTQPNIESNAIETILNSNRTSLFDIDSYNGKIYINRELMHKSGYRIGDRFILTIIATAFEPTSDSVLNPNENTVTYLVIRLTERDYSFFIPIKNSLNKILWNYLNPLNELYLPRLMDSDGVRLSIQDLVVSNLSSTPDLTKRNEKSKALIDRNEVRDYNLVIQLGSRNDNTQIDLDFLVDLLGNVSSSNNKFMKEFQGGIVKREPEVDARLMRNDNSQNEPKPFYTNWIFWLLLIIGFLLLFILICLVNCILLTKKQHKKSKKPGIIIEYPPGFNPTYENGVLNLNKKNPLIEEDQPDTRPKNNQISEDQELMMNIEDDFDDE